MENKIQLLDKVMRTLLLISLVLWSLIVHGLFSLTTLIMAFILIVALVNNMKNPPDERAWQIHFLATYGAFMTAICFAFLYEAVQYMKTSQVSPVAGYFIAVLLLSQLMFTVIFRKGVK